jgi:two-component system NtrC family sensor kinase
MWPVDVTCVDDSIGTVVLIVEDDPVIGDLVAEIVARAGCVTTVARSYREALAAAARGRIDLVISDMVLGGDGDGHDVVEAVRALCPEVQVLFISGYARGRFSFEEDPVLAKPFTPDELLSRIRSLLSATE